MTPRESKIMSITFIVTALGAFLMYTLFREDQTVALEKAKSERITSGKADSLEKEYLSFKPMYVKHRGRDGNGADTIADLNGFIFSAAQLKEIIDSNHSGRKDVDAVAFYFGKEGHFRTGLNRHANLHIIAIGIKNDTLLNKGLNDPTTKAALAPSIFDKADPCPPNCPKNRLQP